MVLVAVAALVTGGCRAEELPPARAVESSGDPAPAADKVAPRWEAVATFAGAGDERTAGFEIVAGAIQWRAKVSCTGAGRG